MMPALSTRVYQDELMDGSDYTCDEYAQCLRQIELINKLTNGYAPTLRAIESFMSVRPDSSRPLRILDVGFGHGDTLRAIAKWAARRGVGVALTGIDIQPQSADLAYRVTPPSMQIKYLTGDVFEHQPETSYDIVLNALFMHHLDDETIVRMLRWMNENSQIGFFINDLHRHPFAYRFIGGFTKIFGFNRLIQHDAPLSVARGFTSAEWKEYADRAGLESRRLEVRWNWAFRHGVRYARNV